MSEGARKKFLQRRAVKAAFLAFLVALLGSFVDPFGLKDATDERSVQYLERIKSPFYPAKGQSEVSVVVIDNNSIKAVAVDGDQDRTPIEDYAGFTYPLRYSDYAKLIEALLVYKPAAIFFDIILFEGEDRLQKRDEIEGILRWNIDKAGDSQQLSQDPEYRIPYVPIFFPDPGAIAVRAKPETKCTRPIDEKGFFRTFAHDRPFIFKSDQFGSYYPVVAENSCAGSREFAKTLSPAFMMLEVFCQKNPAECRGLAKDTDGKLELGQFEAPLSLEWGDTITPYTEQKYAGECAQTQEAQGWLQRSPFGRLLTYSYDAIVNNEDLQLAEEPEALCTFHSSIGTYELLYEHRYSQSHSKWSDQIGNYCLNDEDEIGNPHLERMLCGKYVFVGLGLTGISDIVESPVHGRLPGVFSHAMAMDNLITKGSDYQREPTTVFWEFDTGSIIELFLLLICLIVEVLILPTYFMWFGHKLQGGFLELRAEPEEAEPKKAAQSLFASVRISKKQLARIAKNIARLTIGCLPIILLISAVAITLEMIFASYLKYEPNNWLGILSVAIASLAFTWRSLQEETEKINRPIAEYMPLKIATDPS